MRYLSAISVVALISCGGAEFESSADSHDYDAGTEDVDVTNNAGNSSVAGKSGSGGVAVSDFDAGENISDFDGGDFADAGAGGTGGVNNTGGSGGTGGTNTPCVPKTCLTLAIEITGQISPAPSACNVLEDGCGNYIDCGGCTNEVEACGTGAPKKILNESNSIEYIQEEGTPNICGGGCLEETDPNALLTYCGNNGHTKVFFCPSYYDFSNPPGKYTGCVSYNPRWWCCQ